MTEVSLLVVEDKTQEHHQSTIPASIDSKSKTDESSACVPAFVCETTGVQREFDDGVRAILHINK